MAMVQVTDKKGKNIHRMRLDPGFTSLFLLYRYCCWKRQSCHTINTHTHDTISASGYTRESSSNQYTNTYPYTDDRPHIHSDNSPHTNAYSDINSDTATNNRT